MKTLRSLISYLWSRKRKLFILGCLSFVVLYSLLYILVSTASSPTDEFILLRDGRTLAYKIHNVSPKASQEVILIHGNPGDANAWARLERHVGNGKIRRWIAIDRLGYGNSSAEQELTLAGQAKSILELIDAICESPPLLVGHSYGGSVALRVAVDNPDAIAGLVLVSSACDPDLPDSRSLRTLLDRVSFLIPHTLNVCNRELIALTAENIDMQHLLTTVSCPVTVIHGTDDSLCPYQGNIDYLQRQLQQASPLHIVSLPSTGHLTHIFNTDIILQEIEALAAPTTGP